MTNDLALLEDYARNGVQASFGELVNRHLSLVYSAALRQVRSPQLAEEVAQSVFADLARNAGKFKPKTVVAAWLYQVTRRTAIDVIRREARRQQRERVASEIHAMNAAPDDWTRVEPLLDDAMEALDETDRTAILLRYFENKSLREVGEQLGVSDDAAQKRVSRAVERLREFFAKREVKIGATGFVAALSVNSAHAVPAGFAATLTAAVTAGVATSGAAVAATPVIAMSVLQKALVAATVAAVAGLGIYEGAQAFRLRGEVRTLESQQAPLTGQIEQLENELADATGQLAGLREDNARLIRNTTELSRLRAEYALLADELRELKAAAAHTRDDRDLVGARHDSNITEFTAAVTNRVDNGHTMVIGGWRNKGLRTYLLITPRIQRGDDQNGEHQLSIESRTIEAPDEAWRTIGWDPARSNTRNSQLGGVLAPDEIDAVCATMMSVNGAKVSNSSKTPVGDGASFGIALTADDENDRAVGLVMRVRVLPRISVDGRSVSLEVSPEFLRSGFPTHRSLDVVDQ